MPLSKPIAEVLERHLSPTEGAVPHTGFLDEGSDRYLKAVGLDPGGPGLPEKIVLGALEEGRRAGLDPGALFDLAQAYGRGIGRIAAAEAEIVRRLVRGESREGRVAALDELLSRTLPLSALFLEAIHRARVWTELEDTLAEDALEEPDAAERTIALVDLISSTSFLAQAAAGETERMVDAIHEVAQECTSRRSVAPVKFAGDGVFLLGRDAREVVTTTLDAVRALDRGPLPLRARAGVASGPVVRRAGDYFGLTVNLAQRLVRAAAPGSALAERGTAQELPPSVMGEKTTKELRGIPGPTVCVELRHAAAPGQSGG